MAKSNHSSQIKALELAIQTVPFYKDRINVREFSRSDQAILGKALKIYLESYEPYLNRTLDPRIVDIRSFVDNITLGLELEDLLNKFKEIDATPEKEEKQATPKKEESTIPSDLETLVAEYEESKNEEHNTDGSATSVVEAVKRARKSWEIRRKVEQIRENRARLQRNPEEYLKKEQEESDKFFTQTVDPKSKNKQAILSNVHYIAEQAVIAQATNLGLTLTPAQISQASEDISYLGLSGALDLSDIPSLNIISQLALRNLEGVSFISPINDIDNFVQGINRSLSENPYSDEPENNEQLLEKFIRENGGQTEGYFRTSSKIFVTRLRSQDIDLDTKSDTVTRSIDNIHSKLSEVIPNARLPKSQPTPLEKHANELEHAIRQTDSKAAGIAGETLRINPEGHGVRTEAVIKTTVGQSRQLSPEVIHLYSMGLTPEKMANLEKFAQANPNSSIGKLYSSQRDVFNQVRFQLGKIHSSKLGQEISGKLKPLSNAAQRITNTYNKLASPLQKITKFAINPTGAISGFINKKVGEYIGNQLIKQTGSALAKQLGGFILEKGLNQGVKQFAAEQAARLALKLAGKAVVTTGTEVAAGGAIATLSAALGISTAGLSLVIEAAALIIWESGKFVIKKVQQLAESIYGSKISTKEIVVVASLGAVVVGSIFTGIRVAFITTRAAFLSATTIIAISIAVLAFFLGLTFLTAPLLSTFVQLDTIEKVIYTTSPIAPGCGGIWPVPGRVLQGPKGSYSHSRVEAVDIQTPNGQPVKANVAGTISTVGWGVVYGNWVWLNATAPNGTAYTIIFGHLMSINVTPGQQVNQGDIIGIADATSSVPAFRNPHLHLEYRGINYNDCPAGGVPIPQGCIGFAQCGSITAQ